VRSSSLPSGPRVGVLWLFIGAALPLSAQEPPAPPPTPPPLWSGQGELSFVATSGNSDTQTLGVGAEVLYQPLPWTVAFKSAFVRNEADGEEKANSLAAMVRGARAFSPRFEAFARADYLRNRFSGIESRWSGEGGVAYAVFPSPPNKLKVEAALGYATEKRVEGPDPSYPSARLGLFYEWQISKTAVYSEELSFVEDLEETSNWRIVNAGALTADVSTVLALKLSFAILYANEPVPGFGKRDTTFSAAVVAKF
jgi:putative salt-induced outer membrane protein